MPVLRARLRGSEACSFLSGFSCCLSCWRRVKTAPTALLVGKTKGDAFAPSCPPILQGRNAPSGGWFGNGGDGWLRIMEFMPDGKTISVRTCFPLFIADFFASAIAAENGLARYFVSGGKPKYSAAAALSFAICDFSSSSDGNFISGRRNLRKSTEIFVPAPKSTFSKRFVSSTGSAMSSTVGFSP